MGFVLKQVSMPRGVTGTPDRLGSNVQRFVILARLGAGGMGEVLLAEDRVLKRQVAMKAIRSEHSQDRHFCERLLQEAERASQLNDEHIARIYDIAEYDGRIVIIMEYVEGETLRTKMREEPLTTEQFFDVAEQCLAGLAAAHRRGILHCDLKPENLMITPTGLVKILDFGFARHATDETKDSLELDSPAVGGTLAYIAPEVLQGRMPDERADIFSMGVVLYESLAGFHPFRGESARATVDSALKDEPRQLPTSVPAGLDSVLQRMLAKAPSQRYQSCADVLADVSRVHAGLRFRRRADIKAHISSIRTPGLVAAAIVGAFLLSWLTRPPPPRVPPSSRQLVVLPFRTDGDEGSSRAFANGLTETLAAKLGQIAERYPLEVVAASEVRAHKVVDADQARSILGANLALEGTLQQSRDTVRITYSLLDTVSRRQVHSGVITANASNPFAVQDRVIGEVLKDLDIDLEKQDRGRMASHGTEEPQAYDFYLRGRGYLQEYDRSENLDSAIAAFEESLKADPRFALAYAGLGRAHLQKYAISHAPESVMQAQAACSRAVELDKGAADGEICMGMLFNATGKYEEAAQHLQRAVKLDGGREESSRELALAYEGLKRLDDAERSLKAAIAARPQYWAGYKSLGAFFSAHGRYDEAAEQFKRVVELAPDSFSGYSNLGAVYVLQGKYEEAIDVLERSIAIRSTSSALNNLGTAYFYQGKYQEAARVYERAVQMTPNANVTFGNLGEAYGLIEGRQRESRLSYLQALKLTEKGLRVNPNDGQALSYAALYAARLGEKSKAEHYRKLSLRMSAQDPRTLLRSALVLAQLREDVSALIELDHAVKEGLSISEITNDPAWRRFGSYPAYAAIIAKDHKRQ
jgi:serine/threonine protein kinase/tetratricopeptide (TPR) repeat protein